MDTKFSFWTFLKEVIKKRRWSYIGGIISVIILDAVDMIPALIIREVTDRAQNDPLNFNVLPYSLGLVACYLLISLLRLSWRFLIMIPSRYIEQDLRQKAYDKLLQSNFIQTSHLKIGDVVSTLSQELSNIRMFMGPGILIFFDSLAYMIFIPITLFYILGTGAFWVLLPFTFLIMVLIIVHRPFEEGFTRISEELGDLSQYVFEESQGVRFFRSEGLVQLRRSKYDLLLSSLMSRQLNVTKWELGLDATLQFVIQSSYFTVLVLSWQGHGAMANGLGALTVTIQLLDKLTWPLMSIGYLMNLYQQARTGAKRLQVINELNPKKDGEQIIQDKIKSLKLKNLNVHSLEGITLLQNINLEIKPGEHIALVGSVGSGKTVLLQTLAGLWEKDQLSYDNFEINQIDYQHLKRASYHRLISFIPQTAQIFSRTLGLNLSPAAPFNEKSMWDSLEKADLSKDVKRFPEGLSTQIGEKGMNLSGGQKQRTLITRSFHSKANIFLWDDSISALDPVTEQNIITNLRYMDAEAILILATHRLSSLRNFNRIVILDKGRIIKIGTFEEIKKDSQLFSSLLKDENELKKVNHYE